jgi:hypothetical protein
MIDLKSTINDEQLLDICLSLVALEEYKDEFFSGPAGKIITARAVSNILNKQEEFTEEEVCDEISMMITGKIIENLTKKDLIEVDLSGDEPLYGLNESNIGYFENND